MSSPSHVPAVMSPEQFLAHWQGHRRLTRRVIEAFPEDQLFSYSVGGMRPFSDIAREMLGIAVPMVRGVVSGEWTAFEDAKAASKAQLLQQWDEHTKELDSLFSRLPVERFQETMTAFGAYTDTLTGLLWYAIDNEVHHRGQGYVYLRTLGIEPPPFPERE